MGAAEVAPTVLGGLDAAAEPSGLSETAAHSPANGPCSQSVQLDQRDHLGELQGPLAPRHGDPGLQEGLVAWVLADTPVVHPPGPDANRPGDASDVARPRVAATAHEHVPVGVTLAGVPAPAARGQPLRSRSDGTGW
jgi:hypothetical protein